MIILAENEKKSDACHCERGCMMECYVKEFQELTTTEWYEMARLRSDVFIVEQTSAYHEFDNLDQMSRHIYLKDDGEIVSYCRIIPEGLVYPETTISRVIVKATHRKKGLGRVLLTCAVEEASAHNTKPIQIQAEQYLTDFYASFGFLVVSEPYLDCEIWHVDMVRRISDVSSESI